MSRRSTQREAFRRPWRLVLLLQDVRQGRAVKALCDELATSRATLYRDIEFLESVGVPICSETVNGEVRYRLERGTLPGLSGPLRHAALTLACEALAPFAGSTLLREIEQLRDGAAPKRALAVHATARSVVDKDHMAVIERALAESRVLTLHYRGTHDREPRERVVAPLETKLVKSHLYLAAHDLDADAARTFKLARVTAAHLGEPFDPKVFGKPDFQGAVVAWSGDPVDVEVRLGPAVARFVSEYPLLASQTVTFERDGGVCVRATVAGIEEALRWVLGWGRNAEVIAPVRLRQRVREELAAALGQYGPATRSVPGEQVVSRIMNKGRGRMAGGGR